MGKLIVYTFIIGVTRGMLRLVLLMLNYDHIILLWLYYLYKLWMVRHHHSVLLVAVFGTPLHLCYGELYFHIQRLFTFTDFHCWMWLPAHWCLHTRCTYCAFNHVYSISYAIAFLAAIKISRPNIRCDPQVYTHMFMCYRGTCREYSYSEKGWWYDTNCTPLADTCCMYDLGQHFWTPFICSRNLPVHILIVRVVTHMSLWKIIITVLKCFWKLISSLDIHTI